MNALLVVSLVLAADAQAPLKLAMPGLTTVNVDSSAADLYADYFAQHLSSAGNLRVTTRTEVASVLGLERQREMLGCSSAASSCLAELAGALGVEATVVGSLGKLGHEYVMTLKIISAKDGRILADASTRATDESALLDWMGKTAAAMAGKVLAAFGRSDSVATTSVDVTGGTPTWRSRAWIPFTLGAAALVAGAIFYGLALQRAGTLENGTGVWATQALVDQAAKEGAFDQTLGFALMGAGVAAAALGVGFVALGGDGAGPSASLLVGPGGLVVLGSFP